MLTENAIKELLATLEEKAKVIKDLSDRLLELENADPLPPITIPEIDYDAITERILAALPPTVLEIYDDINNDGQYRDGDRLIAVPTGKGSSNPGQEVFRIVAQPPDPIKIRVEGLLSASQGN